MLKEFNVNLRVTEEELKCLEIMATRSFRYKSDIVRMLIHQAWDLYQKSGVLPAFPLSDLQIDQQQPAVSQ